MLMQAKPDAPTVQALKARDNLCGCYARENGERRIWCGTRRKGDISGLRLRDGCENCGNGDAVLRGVIYNYSKDVHPPPVPRHRRARTFQKQFHLISLVDSTGRRLVSSARKTVSKPLDECGRGAWGHVHQDTFEQQKGWQRRREDVVQTAGKHLCG
ncbi:hypothetical protein BV22DRAFT_186395 [Leucogyrophana mollusca]|uniref:Uncharacterized protein n=1 Tax=Leucogyrophana mollusca TaxID=85980 RepID=A0ACB8BRW5_9AGAM|nr:hypothetical protein BV22DRAFT_186395 [Leucogyrophana mollusca]